MTIKLEYQKYLLESNISIKELKDAWKSYAFKFNFLTEEFEENRKKYKIQENPLKVENHPIIVSANNQKNIETESNIFLDFVNTEFSIEGCTKFASKHGMLGIENNFEFNSVKSYNDFVELRNMLKINFKNFKNPESG